MRKRLVCLDRDGGRTLLYSFGLVGCKNPSSPVVYVIFQNASFQEILPQVRQHIIDGFSPSALDMFTREFDFFDKVTSISGVLFPLPKEERRAGIRRYDFIFHGMGGYVGCKVNLTLYLWQGVREN